MRKSIALFVVFTMLILMTLPTAALASGKDTGKSPSSSNKAPVIISDRDGTADTSLGETDGVRATAFGTVGPIEYTKSLKLYSDGSYYANVDFTATAKGFYTFCSLGSEDTDIYFKVKGDTKVFDSDVENGPFAAWVYLDSGVTYTIQLRNWGSSSSISYLITTPCTLGTTAFTISPNGLSASWMQAFDFDIPSGGDYSIHISSPAGSSFYWALYKGNDYPLDYIDSPNDSIGGELFHTFSLSAGSYHLALWLYNSSSKTASFTISMDTAGGSTTGITAGVPCSSAVSANDTLTANSFTPSRTGNYALKCDPGDVKITVSAETKGGDGKDIDNYLVQNASPNTAVNLTAGTKYFLFYVTNGAAETINYSADYIPSQECKLISVDTPFAFDGHLVWGSGSGSTAINPKVSDFASPKLYSDKDCTSEISAWSDGLNRDYLKVTAEDNNHWAIYPILFYLSSGMPAPAAVVYDSNYNEVKTGGIITGSAHVLIFGCAHYSITQNGGSFTWDGSSLITGDGQYEITPSGGTAFDFAIDNSAPAITATSGGNPVPSGTLCNKDVTVTVSDDHPGTNTAKKDGADYAWPSGGTFTEDGSYIVTAADLFGHSSTFSFTLDKTPPVITATDSSGNPILSGSFGFKPVTVSVSGNSDKPTATKNGASFKWPSKDKFTASGTYVVTAKDTAGSITTFTFTIDSSKPIITAKAGTKTIKNNGSANKSVTVTVSDTNIDPAYPTVTEDGASKAWPDHGVFTGEGKYFVTAKDRSGNITTLTFTIDLPPVLSVTSNGAALNNNGITAYDVNITKSDKFMKTYSLKKDGKTFAWPADGSLTADGIYSITLQDKIGNKTSVKFTIDKKAPVISAGTTLLDGVYTNKSYVTVKISDLTKLTVKTVTKNGAAIAYPSSGKFSAEGSYVITATDSADHTSAFTFTIDRTAPVINASAGGLTVVKGSTVTSDVDLSITETNISAITITKDGADLYQYPRDATIWNGTGTYTLNQNGLYVITLTDKAGNKATTTFRINKP